MVRKTSQDRSPGMLIYTPEPEMHNPGIVLRAMFRDLRLARELAWRLAVRDISAQYRQTALGLTWILLLPLANSLTWIFLSSSSIVNVKPTEIPFQIYVLTGTILWSIFMDAVNAPLHQTIAAKPLLTKLNFPREALLISGIYQTTFNGAIKIGLVLLILLTVGIHPTAQLILFPVGFFSLIIAGTVIGLLLTPVGFLFTDVGKGLPLLLQFLMYLTPVVYPVPNDGWASIIMQLNPLTTLIETSRDWLTGYSPTPPTGFLVISICIFVLLFTAWGLYRVSLPILISRMNS